MREVRGDVDGARCRGEGFSVLLNVIGGHPGVVQGEQEADRDLQAGHEGGDGMQVIELNELVVGHSGNVAQERRAKHVDGEIRWLRFEGESMVWMRWCGGGFTCWPARRSRPLRCDERKKQTGNEGRNTCA